MSGILIDTSVWVRYLRPQGYEKLKAEVEKVLAAGVAFTCWVVKAELLVGAKDEKAFEQLLSGLQALEEVALSPELWKAAARLGHLLRRQGFIIPLPHLLIAQAAIFAGLELWHADEHFERIQQASSLRTRSFLAPDGS
ncbi:MAG: PIN domain-containing protein [Armatimonadota bacterium]|nr:PIN domain-containing protein [Armatimonadota bacterium]MDR5704256.1 PIN domain-containing protein [Armatimonadota bacterium]